MPKLLVQGKSPVLVFSLISAPNSMPLRSLDECRRKVRVIGQLYQPTLCVHHCVLLRDDARRQTPLTMVRKGQGKLTVLPLVPCCFLYWWYASGYSAKIVSVLNYYSVVFCVVDSSAEFRFFAPRPRLQHFKITLLQRHIGRLPMPCFHHSPFSLW